MGSPLVLVAALSTIPLVARAQDTSNAIAAKEWNQPRGNAAGTAALDVEPLVSEPLPLWSRDLDGAVCAPVTWAGVIYALAGKGSKRTLLALRIEDGEPLGRAPMAGDGPTWLAAWQGTVAVVGAEKTALYQQKGTLLRHQESLPRGSRYPPCVYGGWLFVADGSRIAGIELRGGDVHELCEGGPYRPSVLPGAKDGAALLATARHVTRNKVEGLEFASFALALAGKTPGVSGRDSHLGSSFGANDQGALDAGYLARMEESQAWFVFTPRALLSSRGPSHASIIPLDRMAPIAGDAAVQTGFVYGFSDESELIRVQPDGSYGRVITADRALPAGAKNGSVTMARQVLYLGNWAVDTVDGRILWCLEDVDPASPVLPLADGRIALVTRKGELACLGGSVAAPRDAAAASASAPARPGTGPGVVLNDGRRVGGAVTALAGERLRVESKPPIELEHEDVALIEDAEGARLVGEEYGVFLAWWDALRLEQLAMLEQLFEEYRSGGHLDQCRRLLERAGLLDAAPEWIDARNRSLAGKAPNRNANAAQQSARIQRGEQERSARSAADFTAASRWCAEHHMPTAATVLLSRAERIAPVEARAQQAQALIPAGMPGRDAQDAGRRWMRFAEELLPSGAVFVGADHELSRRDLGQGWKDAPAFQTDNLVLLTHVESPEVLGGCLRNGEGVLRVLNEVFSVPSAPGAGSGRLEVRLHRDRESYLKDLAELGAGDMSWSAGAYSPGEHISRFYVPGSEEGSTRSLDEVLVHELTHQFLAERWMKGVQPAPSTPAFWMIEGVAEFFEGQVVDLGRRRRGIDDRKARSIDVSAQLAAAGKLMPLERFLPLSQAGFARLGDSVLQRVSLRHSLGSLDCTERTAFYSQAASLFFFLFHERGEDGRARLIELLRSAYSKRVSEDPARELGFESVAELERVYRAFLESTLR